ncbi:MAG: hypothetical protein KBT13_10365 [Bacteroidales bacterium]|nr:hypothetical protein [Candidatus Sodaliphilus limicaballi]
MSNKVLPTVPPCWDFTWFSVADSESVKNASNMQNTWRRYKFNLKKSTLSPEIPGQSHQNMPKLPDFPHGVLDQVMDLK